LGGVEELYFSTERHSALNGSSTGKAYLAYGMNPVR